MTQKKPSAARQIAALRLCGPFMPASLPPFALAARAMI
jgi:hypothetical protein